MSFLSKLAKATSSMMEYSASSSASTRQRVERKDVQAAEAVGITAQKKPEKKDPSLDDGKYVLPF